MCTVCGCGQGESRIEGQDLSGHDHRHRHPHAHDHVHGHEHPHTHADGTVHSHPHTHSHRHDHTDHDHLHDPLHGEEDLHAHDHAPQAAALGTAPGAEGHDHLHFGEGPARAHAPGMSQERMVRIEQDILAKNDGYAAANRQRLAERGIFAVNLVSSPGSGKTSLLVRTIEALKDRVPIAVVEGDQQTSADADRIRATGAPAIQINTGKGCHLDAHMVGHALDALGRRAQLPDDSLLLIENVGNLVCPAAFDLGEARKAVILSVTEGEDKPLKYPDMFHAAGIMLLNKVDLLPHLDFDVERCIEYARRVNPRLEVMRVSARTGEGMDAWLAWLAAGLAEARAVRERSLEALKRRIAELEAQVAALSGAGSGTGSGGA